MGFEFPEAARARITTRWPTAEAFYAERDDRTIRGVHEFRSFASTAIEIHVDPVAVESATVQRMTLVVANLTARWARRVRIMLPSGVLLVPEMRRDGAQTLEQRVSREMAMADPFGDFEILISSEPPIDRAIRLYVGPWRGDAGIGPEDYQVHAVAWNALGRRGSDSVILLPEFDGEATVAAAALAGSLGAADLFKRAIEQRPEHWLPTFSWDTWDSRLVKGGESWSQYSRRDVTPHIDMRRSLLGGVGAIGSAFLYLADLGTVSGSFILLDRDRVDTTNLNRSPLFSVLDALDSSLKTSACEKYLVGRGMQVSVLNGTWREHAEAVSARALDVWISLTNEDSAWAELPFALPPVVLHATTTSGWGFATGRHIPRREDCTLCRMPRPTAEFRGPCAQGSIEESRPEIRASLPFLSAAAAALLLASRLQLEAADSERVRSLANDISADLCTGLPAVIALTRRSTEGCSGCRAAQRRAWIRQGGRGAFAVLSF